MLLKQTVLDGIKSGAITEVYRNWKRPTVKAGGSLNTAVGQLSILSVEKIALSKLTAAGAMRAGFATLDELVGSLRQGEDRTLYRVQVELGGEDPRIALRNATKLSADEVEELRAAFDRFDKKPVPAGLEPVAMLKLLAENEGVRAPDLAASFGVETKWFKTRVRRLKTRGLTESLRVGYRLSPRGAAALDALG